MDKALWFYLTLRPCEVFKLKTGYRVNSVKARLFFSGQACVSVCILHQCRLLWWTLANCVCLYTGAQAWIGWSPGAALPPTWAAPRTRALLLLPTGRHQDRAS